jgi:hypothetical protein
MTKQDKIAALKTQYPTLRVGSEETGYTELSAEDYEAKIAEWADNALAKEAQEIEALATKTALLDKLGITQEEAQLLLGGTN